MNIFVVSLAAFVLLVVCLYYTLLPCAACDTSTLHFNELACSWNQRTV